MSTIDFTKANIKPNSKKRIRKKFSKKNQKNYENIWKKYKIKLIKIKHVELDLTALLVYNITYRITK